MQVIYKTIYWAFMAAVLALGGLLMVSLVPQTGIAIKIVKSGSMEPVIKTGSIVVDKPESTYKVGDIVTFGADTKTQVPTTHRITAIESQGGVEYITTKGDANNAPDSARTPISAVHGKVLFTVPYLGYVLAYARTKLGFALLVGLPASLIILEEVMKIFREVARLRRRKPAAAPFPPYRYEIRIQPKIRRIVD